MADIASLVVKVSTDGVNKAQSDLDKLAKQSSKTESATTSLTNSSNLLNVALSSIAIGTLLKESAKLADIYKLTEGRLSLVTKNTIELATAQQEILKISQNTRQSFADTIDLYTRVARSTQDLGKSQSDILKFTEIVNKSLVISGASAENSKAAIIQLGQALGSGVLQGDELRSILENAPRLAEAIAKGMSKTVGELKTLGEQGKLTAEEVFNAIQKQGDSINEEFGKMPKTIGQATTQMGNSILELVGTMDKLTGASGFVADKISSLSKIMDDFSSNARVASSSVFEQKTVDDITIKANQIASEIQSLQTKLKENDGALWFGLDDRTQSEYINKIKRLEQQMEQLGQTAVDVLWKTSQGTKSAVLSGEQVKKQVDDALSGYKAYYQAIGDNETVLSIKRREYAEKYKNLTAQQIDAIINSERDKNNKTEKLAEEWQKRKIEIATNISIAEQDELAKPYIKLTSEYEQDIERFKSIQGAKEQLTKEYNAEVQRLNEETVKKFDKQQQEELKKSVEWQVKIFEAGEKLNDQLFEQREKMYGEDSARQIEAWYQNQLEMLGKLAIEGKATEKEISGLLAQIEAIKTLKIEETTLSFKVEKTFYNSFEKNLADSIESGFKDADLKSILRSIGKDIWSSVASYSANNITSLLRGGASLGALAIGSSVSASEIANIMNSGGTFDSATNTITTSGGSKINVGSDGGGTVKSTGSDVMSLVNTISTLKTAYTVATTGISNSIMAGFTGVSDALAGAGMWGASAGVSNFGYGFANPFSYGVGNGAFGSTMAGGALSAGLLGGAVGYGTGWLGDKLFGANTYASIGGLTGGALGGIGASLGVVGGPLGILGGSLLGSALGGIFGKKKVTDTGIQFFKNIDSLDKLSSDTVKAYSDWEKKGWFSKSSGTNLSDLSANQMKQIEAVFDTYDYLLTQLGDSDRITLEAGKYSGESFANALTKNFITAFTDVNQSLDSTIYDAWVDYAESVDKTVTEALQESINTFITEKRTFEIWALGDSVEALAKKAQFAQEDFNNLEKTLGVSGVTVENYLSLYEDAVKNSFDANTIANWANLGNALMTATDASSAYTDALKAQSDQLEAQRQATLNSLLSRYATIDSALVSFDESLNGIDYQKKFDEASSAFSNLTGLVVTNYDELIKASQILKNNTDLTDLQTIAFTNLGDALLNLTKNTQQWATDKIAAYNDILLSSLNNWKTVFSSIQESIDTLTKSNITYLFSDFASMAIDVTNYEEQLSNLESARQNEINLAKKASDDRINQLQKEKTLFEDITSFASDIQKRIIDYTSASSTYFFAELANTKSIIESGNIADLSNLKSSANTYLDKVLDQSTSRLDYLREVSKVQEGVSSLGNLATGGSLEGIQNAITQEENTLATKLDDINNTAIKILETWQGTASTNITDLTNLYNESNDRKLVRQAYSEILGVEPTENSLEVFSNRYSSGELDAQQLFRSIGIEAVMNDYFAENAMRYLNNAGISIDGSHAGGLDRVPFDGYIAELHKDERVQTASEVQKDTIIKELTVTLDTLKQILTTSATSTKEMAKIFNRIEQDGALRTVAV